MRAILLGSLLTLGLMAGGRGRQDPPDLAGPDEFRAHAECRECHQVIGREWAESAHAQTGSLLWQRLQEYDSRMAERLRPYYFPALLLGSSWQSSPQSRSVFLQAGVDCLSCHMDEEYRMRGPHGLAAPHRTQADERFQDARVCLFCHGRGDELDQAAAWRAAGFEAGELPCQVCHMPEVRRSLVQHWALQELPQRNGRRHVFRGVRDQALLESAVHLEVTPGKGEREVEVALSAGGVGHSFPGIAFRQLVLLTEGLASGSEPLWERREVLDGVVHRNRLRSGERRTYSYSRGEARRVRARLFYKWTPRVPLTEALLLKEVQRSFQP